ncbi:unnamed protein product [Ectocarpus sp. 6 AP-2014]
MAVRVALAAANIAGISFAGKSPRWMPNWPSLSGIDQKTLEDVFDPRHVEEYVRGDLPPSIVRKFGRRKRRVDDLVGLLRYAWARKLEHVSELARLTHEKELHSAVSAALSVSTDVAEGAEGEPGLLGPTPAEEFFSFSTGRRQRCPPHGGHHRCSRHGHHGHGRPILGCPRRTNSHPRHKAASGRRGRGHRLAGALRTRPERPPRPSTSGRGGRFATSRRR